MGQDGHRRWCLQWACADSGRWDEALAAAREAAEIAGGEAGFDGAVAVT